MLPHACIYLEKPNVNSSIWNHILCQHFDLDALVFHRSLWKLWLMILIDIFAVRALTCGCPGPSPNKVLNWMLHTHNCLSILIFVLNTHFHINTWWMPGGGNAPFALLLPPLYACLQEYCALGNPWNLHTHKSITGQPRALISATLGSTTITISGQARQSRQLPTLCTRQLTLTPPTNSPLQHQQGHELT